MHGVLNNDGFHMKTFCVLVNDIGVKLRFFIELFLSAFQLNAVHDFLLGCEELGHIVVGQNAEFLH